MLVMHDAHHFILFQTSTHHFYWDNLCCAVLPRLINCHILQVLLREQQSLAEEIIVKETELRNVEQKGRVVTEVIEESTIALPMMRERDGRELLHPVMGQEFFEGVRPPDGPQEQLTRAAMNANQDRVSYMRRDVLHDIGRDQDLRGLGPGEFQEGLGENWGGGGLMSTADPCNPASRERFPYNPHNPRSFRRALPTDKLKEARVCRREMDEVRGGGDLGWSWGING